MKRNQFHEVRQETTIFRDFHFQSCENSLKRKIKNRRKVIVELFSFCYIFIYTIVSCSLWVVKKNVTHFHKRKIFKLKKTYTCFFFLLLAYLCGDIISAFPRYVEVATSDSHIIIFKIKILCERYEMNIVQSCSMLRKIVDFK